MTQKANPSINRPAEAFKTAGAIALAGGSSTGWVSPSTSPSEISVQDDGITEGNLAAFDSTTSETSLDVDISGGEAFVFGSWLAIDTTTTITLDASTTGQTVYVGWNKNGSDDVIVGLNSAFDSASGNTDKKIELWTFDTDGSGVTETTDERTIGQYHDLTSVDVAEQLGIPLYSDDANAPNGTFYFNDTDSELKYKESNGTISGASSTVELQEDGTTSLESAVLNFSNEDTDPGVLDFDITDDGNGNAVIKALQDINFIFATTFDDLPDPANVNDPTIAYVEDSDDYLGVFQA